VKRWRQRNTSSMAPPPARRARAAYSASPSTSHGASTARGPAAVRLREGWWQACPHARSRGQDLPCGGLCSWGRTMPANCVCVHASQLCVFTTLVVLAMHALLFCTRVNVADSSLKTCCYISVPKVMPVSHNSLESTYSAGWYLAIPIAGDLKAKSSNARWARCRRQLLGCRFVRCAVRKLVASQESTGATSWQYVMT
jgi:hypothetical protein